MKIKMFLIAVIIFLSTYLHASGTSGGDILEVNFSARELAMGQAGVADFNDVGLINPAGLTNVSQLYFSAGRVAMGTSLTQIGIVVPVKNKIRLAALRSELKFESDEMRDENNVMLGIFESRETLYDFLFAFEVVKDIHFGAKYTLCDMNLAGYAGKTILHSVGLIFDLTPFLKLGGSMGNIGAGVKYDREVTPFERVIQTGISINYGKISLMGDWKKQGSQDFYMTGAEIKICKSLALRTGYKIAPKNELAGNISAGIALSLSEGLKIDFSASDLGPLGIVQRLGISTNF